MRLSFFVLIFLVLAGLSPSFADDEVVQEFSGSGSTTTGFFTVKDRWEVRWNALRVVSIAVMASNGSIIAGEAGVLRGSLFLPLGGKYYFKITDGTASAKGTPPATPAAPEPAVTVSWHLQVVQLGTTEAAGQDLTVYTPFFVPPDSAIAPAPPAPPAPELSPAQIASVVVLQGKNSQGHGFLVRMADGCFVATHLHVLANNPDVRILTTSGVSIPGGSLKGAPDRDLALISIPDNHYSCLALPANLAATTQLGDPVLVPAVIGQEVLLRGAVTVKGIVPKRIDLAGGLSSANLDMPVIHQKSGNALALITAAMRKSDLSPTISKAWPGNAPDIFTRTTYYGLRLDDVHGWETYDPARFQLETAFLQQFHQATRCLDSYLNGAHHHDIIDDSGPPDDRYYRKSAQILSAQEHYQQFANGADYDQRLDAARELLFDLDAVAEKDVTALQQLNSPYSYDQNKAKEELAYRQALKTQIDAFQGNIVELDRIARRR